MLDPVLLAARPAFATLVSTDPAAAGVSAKETLGNRLTMVEARKGRQTRLAERFRSEFGLALPTGPHRTASVELTLLGIGPLKWLAISAFEETSVPQRLERALHDSASLIDLTGGLALLRISGPRARETFAKGLPIDLDQSEFAIDDVAVSAIAQVAVTVWRLDDAVSFGVAVPRSYADSFAHWLQESAAEFGLAVE
ncbi:MAG TPA: sarcosine oxidase subunit gamma family protein [Roseiarcus sp.]|nr:sarcosine oxidase subunit gamma family protein [Roseiarcus sp.]